MIEAIHAYLELFSQERSPKEITCEDLTEVLDRLLVAYHDTRDAAPDSETHPPSLDYDEVRERVQRSFPGFGYYAWSAPEALPGDAVMTGDAIDDLADIYKELSGVAWLSENSSIADAAWHFRFGFRSHWGRHLLDLRSYLHWRLFEQ
jgi:hypothetical protein